MRLAPITGTPFKFQCLHCGQWKVTDSNTLADLDGEPFKAYYCGKCTAETGASRTMEEV